MRADVYLTQYGHAASRSRAAKLIEEGSVLLDGIPLQKVSEAVDEMVEHTVEILDDMPYVGRGGLKLEHALNTFGGACAGRRALDVGASTGGFTDCLLQRGALHVFAVDAGSGQLAPALCRDARVTNIEHCNARYLNAAMLGEHFPAQGVELIVMDVSFISQTLILPSLVPLLSESGEVITLIKPQFELGRSQIGKGGIVRSDTARKEAILRVLEGARLCGLQPMGLIVSPIKGGDGNVEYLLHLQKQTGEDAGLPPEAFPASVGL